MYKRDLQLLYVHRDDVSLLICYVTNDKDYIYAIYDLRLISLYILHTLP